MFIMQDGGTKKGTVNGDYGRVKLTWFLVLVEMYKKQEFEQINIYIGKH